MRISDWSSDVCSSDLTHQRLGNASYNHDVAWSGDRVAEQVEAGADIADAGRRKRACLAAMLAGAHARAPSSLAIPSSSPKTPAPVTPGPAPGPRQTSRFSAYARRWTCPSFAVRPVARAASLGP